MKTLDEFVALCAELFDNTDASEITATTAFHELDGWSSLVGLSLIGMIAEEFNIGLKGDDIKSATTVQDIFNRVVALKG